MFRPNLPWHSSKPFPHMDTREKGSALPSPRPLLRQL